MSNYIDPDTPVDEEAISALEDMVSEFGGLHIQAYDSEGEKILAEFLEKYEVRRRTVDPSTLRCEGIALDGERCLRSPGHDGRCYSRMATPENVAKCLRQMPDGSKCHLKMNHAMPHRSNTSEELS
ncbi:hypothetical protein KNT99_gp06 [Gordonia phage NatB6]|uniref:Uncharacterized protein n=1 Tax=Gordonia phage NatB6 TaxID=2250322 RepID=A0A345L4T4_9CAUD|nr:hypothetical protein KNT99_gp06 [Gordonia phage NatB6]AXH50286.1 hypothetical protein SEA_NATB6_6 [Gordonia phage NatB6]